MGLKSMTGFARQAGGRDGFSWNWEVKSVNGKGLDIKYRIPSMLDGFDLKAKACVSGFLGRGSVFIALELTEDAGEAQMVVNRDRLDVLLDVARELADKPGVAPARIDGLLNSRGIIDIQGQQMDEATRALLDKDLLASLGSCCEALVRARSNEGERTAVFLNEQLDQIADLVSAAADCASARVENIKARLQGNVAALLEGEAAVPEERLAQEIALIAVKADIREELDRLDCHIADARDLLTRDKPVGRRLDFLCQEFNREANTLCSKSQDKELTRIGLDLKTIIDQFREQIQNIE